VSGSFQIGARQIGPGCPVYVIAEVSANHNQNFDQAVHIVQAAGQAGADAIKLQTYTADTMTIACDGEYFRIRGGTGAPSTIFTRRLTPLGIGSQSLSESRMIWEWICSPVHSTPPLWIFSKKWECRLTSSHRLNSLTFH